MGRIAPAGQPRPEGRRQHRDRPQAAAHRAHSYLRAGPRRRLLQPDAPRHDEPGRPRCHRGGPAGQPGALPRSVGRPAGSPPGLSPAGQGQPRRQPAPAGCPRRQPPGGRCPRPRRALPEPGQPGRGAARRRRRGAVRRPFRCTALRRQRTAALLGLSRSETLLLYALQLLLLGLLASAIGALLGWLAQLGLFRLLATLLPPDVPAGGLFPPSPGSPPAW